MKSQSEKLKEFGNILEAYVKDAHRTYETGNQRKEDLPLVLERLKEEFYKFFPKVKKQ